MALDMNDRHTGGSTMAIDWIDSIDGPHLQSGVGLRTDQNIPEREGPICIPESPLRADPRKKPSKGEREINFYC